jgi:hypothetical protein
VPSRGVVSSPLTPDAVAKQDDPSSGRAE